MCLEASHSIYSLGMEGFCDYLINSNDHRSPTSCRVHTLLIKISLSFKGNCFLCQVHVPRCWHLIEFLIFLLNISIYVIENRECVQDNSSHGNQLIQFVIIEPTRHINTIRIKLKTRTRIF